MGESPGMVLLALEVRQRGPQRGHVLTSALPFRMPRVIRAGARQPVPRVKVVDGAIGLGQPITTQREVFIPKVEQLLNPVLGAVDDDPPAAVVVERLDHAGRTVNGFRGLDGFLLSVMVPAAAILDRARLTFFGPLLSGLFPLPACQPRSVC